MIDIDERAEKIGWTPEDRYVPEEHDGKPFVSAEKFLENESFFKKIASQKERIDDLEGTVAGLTDHYEKSTQVQLKKANDDYETKIKALQVEKVNALNEQDHEKVVDIDEQIRTEPTPEKANSDSNPAFDDWVKDNEWYIKDTFLRIEAIKVAEIYNSEGHFGKKLYNMVTDHIKEAHPAKFENPNRQKAQTVEGNVPSKPRNKTLTEKDLTDDERTVYQKFRRSLKTEEAKTAYLNSVIEMRG